ncbi:MAG: TIGR01212 family radical SAM protein [Acutalibacteraceae bacterium]|nr:TIGR01212 family radical SAM protein [Acutalibacteraceae bacterium]
MKYKTLNEHYRQKFGCKVYKLSLDGGFTCPNRDGTIGTGGCIFCSGSSEFAEKSCGNIQEQLLKAKSRVESKNKNGKYIAYFQSFTNTYAPVEHLRKLFYEAIEPDYIVGLSIGTRPDCLEQEKIELLKEINKIKPVSVELGLQTIHDTTAQYINRGYKSEVYIDAVRRLKESDIETVTHIIIGLPFENKDMIKETVKLAVKTGTDGIKFHSLYVIEGTPLAEEYRQGKFKTLKINEYAQILKECIALLRENTVVHRITGDGSKKNLIAPLWSADKKKVLNYLNKYLDE